MGVEGVSFSTGGTGVYGLAFEGTGLALGVIGESHSKNGRGVYGVVDATSGLCFGVFGETQSTMGYGVYGKAHATTGTTYGGYFSNSSTSGRGVVGINTATSGTIYGVYGIASTSAGGFAVYASGDMGASGVKPFRIDHRADPENKYLLHYAAESPEAINFYRGMVTLDAAGEAPVVLPDYFARINKLPSYQLTAVGAAMPSLHVASEISEEALATGAAAAAETGVPRCSFRIAGGQPAAKVSWEVKAVRNDAYVRLRGAPVEIEKDAVEPGTYQHPELFGQPPERGFNVIPTPPAVPSRSVEPAPDAARDRSLVAPYPLLRDPGR